MSDRQTHDHYPFIKFEPKGATTSTGFPSGGLPYLACGCGWNDLGDTGWTDHLEDEASRGPDLAGSEPFEYGGALVNQRFASDVEPSPDLDARREWIASFEGTGWTPEDRQPDQGGVWLTRKNGDSLWVSAADSARLVNEVAAGLDEGGLHRALAAHMAAFMEQPESFENPDDVVASIAAHYAALVPAATSDVEPGPTGTWSKDVAWEAPGGNPTPPTSDVGPRADPFTERAEHERQSTAGTHLGDPHCPFCFFDHFDGETRANLYRASDVEPSPDLDVAERDTLRAVYEFWQGRPDLAPGIRLRERVRAALHTETSGEPK